MTFASFDSKSASAPMSDINMVPLIDVMLVLLVIFIITAPLLNGSEAGTAQSELAAQRPAPEKIEFAIDATGALYWNGEAVARAEAGRRFLLEGKKKPQPEVHLRADQAVSYRFVAQTLADAPKAGLTKVGFISEPDAVR